MTDSIATANPGVEMRPGVWRHEFKNARDFLQALHPLSGFWPPGESWIFRGHADAEWLLLPTAHRAEPWEPLTSINAKCFDPTRANDVNRAQRELQVIREFFDAANEAALSVPDYNRLRELLDPLRPLRKASGNTRWPDAELVPILALAQHYGLPTCLLDWSRLGRVAAYFAALPSKQEGSHAAVWALKTSGNSEIRSVADTANWHIATAPRSSNPNLHAQSGLFTFCHWFAETLSPLDELVSNGLANFMSYRKAPGPAPCMMKKMVLPRQAGKDLMRLLHIDGVSGSAMFPGFNGAAMHVRERLWCSVVNPPEAANA